MLHPDFPFSSQTDLPGIAFAAMRQMMLAQAKAANLAVLVDDETNLTMRAAHGLIGLRLEKQSDVIGLVAAQDERWLFVMKAAVADQMQSVMPAVAQAIKWSNGPVEGSLPLNFMFVEVRDVAQLGPDFIRVTLKGEDLSRYGDDAIHFRLVLPPVESEARWPSVAANGSVIWPEGEGALHKPVYTTRSVDHAANTLVTDIFIHDGGRTTVWAQDLLNGGRNRRVVGLTGPTGGGLMAADRVLVASDETGFPAAARILEALPKDATGDVFLEAESGDKCDYPIDVPQGVTVTWLARADGDCLADATLAALPRHASSKIWFAGEREEARRLRDIAKGFGRAAEDLRISGFWRK